MGSRLGRRMRPPAPATSPRLASGIPKVAWSAATTRSHDSMISQPPARAAPLTAAMIGLGNCRWVMPAKPPEPPMMAPPSPEAKALRSMPGREGLVTGTGDDDDRAPVVGLELVERVGHAHADVAVDGVARLGPVDGEDLDVSSAFAFDCGHRCSFSSVRGVCPGRPGPATRGTARSAAHLGAPISPQSARRYAAASPTPRCARPRGRARPGRRARAGVRRRGDLAPVGEAGDDRGRRHRAVGPAHRGRRHDDGGALGLGRPPGRRAASMRRCARRSRPGANPGSGARRRRRHGVLGGVPAHGADEPGAAVLAQVVDHGGHGVQGVVVAGPTEVGEPAGDGEAPGVVGRRSRGPRRAISTAHGKHEYRSKAPMSSTPRPAAAVAAAAAAAQARRRTEVGARRGEPDVGGVGARPAEHGPVGDAGGARRRERRHEHGRALVHVQEGAHALGVGLGHEAVVGRHRGQLRRGADVTEPRGGVGGGHRR